MKNVKKPIIGILDLQGAVDPHIFHIEQCGAVAKKIKYTKDLEKIDGLIFPGGESSTMLKLLHVFNLWKSIDEKIKTIPSYGVCAGAILLSKSSIPSQKSFKKIDVNVLRNGMGRQKMSRNILLKDYDNYEVSFIRPPTFEKIGKNVKVLAKYDDKPIWIEENNVMITSFHPELNTEKVSPVHNIFIKKVKNNLK